MRAITAKLALSLAPLALALPAAMAERPGWAREEVSWRAGGGRQVRAVHYPPGGSPLRAHPRTDKEPAAGQRPARSGAADTGGYVNVIHSPPTAGFVPWIAISATNKRGEALDVAAVAEPAFAGTPLVANPQAQYAVGLFDTGASTNVVGHASGTSLGLFSAGLVTTNTVTVTGVTGSVDANVTEPFGLFVAGLEAIDPMTMLLNTAGMVGESNVSILVGPEPDPGAPDLASAIGTPMAVFLNAVIRNDQPVTRVVGGTAYSGPAVRLYKGANPQIPSYPNYVPLELRPAGGFAVEYSPCIEVWGGECPGGPDNPEIPSIVSMLGFPLQSLFFVSSSSGVDLWDNGRSSPLNDAFMVDTGAQVTVIGSGIGARLALNPGSPDFEVEIQGLDGQIVMVPGFYIDLIEIPALGELLSFTDVPVVLMDIDSPEGGTLDGIVGMNLLEQYNFVLRGGGLYGQPAPALYFQRVAPAYDADFDNDEDVDLDDQGLFANCAAGPAIPASPQCLAMDADDDNDVDQDDYGVFQRCFSGPGVTPHPNCGL